MTDSLRADIGGTADHGKASIHLIINLNISLQEHRLLLLCLWRDADVMSLPLPQFLLKEAQAAAAESKAAAETETKMA